MDKNNLTTFALNKTINYELSDKQMGNERKNLITGN